jgi:hypothetical protein
MAAYAVGYCAVTYFRGQLLFPLPIKSANKFYSILLINVYISKNCS